MSVDAMWKGKGKDAKGYGKDKPTCTKCGKFGHHAKDCWSENFKGKGEEKGYGEDHKKGYGKDTGYGKGEGDGKEGKGKGDKSQVTSHRCGNTGHFARDCGMKDVRQDTEETQVETAPTQRDR